jgi:chromosomal replication initiation ATPase DnaA
MTNLHTEGLWFIQPEHVLSGDFSIVPRPPKTKTIRQIQLEECQKAGITLHEMLGERRNSRLSQPRNRAMARCVYELKQYSCTQIADGFNKHYTTVMSAAKKYKDELGLLDGAN